MRVLAGLLGAVLILSAGLSVAFGGGSHDNVASAAPPSTEGDGIGSTSPLTAPSTTLPQEPNPGVPAPLEDQQQSVKVIDGDTLVITIGGLDETVRILGINAPETNECLGTRAAGYLQDLVDDSVSVVVVDDAGRDRYGRLLADVIVDEVRVSEALVQNGLAISAAYGRSDAEQRSLDQLQMLARTAGIGVWNPGACGPDNSGSLSVVGLVADAPGDDSKNLNGEWLQIEASHPMELTGWSIRDESSSNRYSFPDGFALKAGESVIVRSGCGVDTPSELFWCASGSAIWNNDGDTAILVDANGSFVSVWNY